jgi:hypothetical protein
VLSHCSLQRLKSQEAAKAGSFNMFLTLHALHTLPCSRRDMFTS